MDIVFINTEILFDNHDEVKLDTLININLLKYHSKCKFVLTDETNLSFDKLLDKLRSHGLPLQPIDIIPQVDAEKGHKINIWLQNNKYDNFVIIDSISNYNSIKNWYNNIVIIDNKKGITDKKRKISLIFLNKRDTK